MSVLHPGDVLGMEPILASGCGAGTRLPLVEFSRVQLLSPRCCFRHFHFSCLIDYFTLYGCVCVCVQAVVLALMVPLPFTLFQPALPWGRSGEGGSGGGLGHSITVFQPTHPQGCKGGGLNSKPIVFQQVPHWLVYNRGAHFPPAGLPFRMQWRRPWSWIYSPAVLSSGDTGCEFTVFQPTCYQGCSRANSASNIYIKIFT